MHKMVYSLAGKCLMDRYLRNQSRCIPDVRFKMVQKMGISLRDGFNTLFSVSSDIKQPQGRMD